MIIYKGNNVKAFKCEMPHYVLYCKAKEIDKVLVYLSEFTGEQILKEVLTEIKIEEVPKGHKVLYVEPD